MLVSASTLLAGLAAVLTVVHAAAIKPAPGKCDKLRVRKEWCVCARACSTSVERTETDSPCPPAPLCFRPPAGAT